mmetsp:Transcript_15203/g.43085  ORF Transcript_15203/g.43085 Transcript_15203/m.43085 type:complete len:236 (+) Transcript_15203:296-1003(+)
MRGRLDPRGVRRRLQGFARVPVSLFDLSMGRADRGWRRLGRRPFRLDLRGPPLLRGMVERGADVVADPHFVRLHPAVGGADALVAGPPCPIAAGRGGPQGMGPGREGSAVGRTSRWHRGRGRVLQRFGVGTPRALRVAPGLRHARRIIRPPAPRPLRCAGGRRLEPGAAAAARHGAAGHLRGAPDERRLGPPLNWQLAPAEPRGGFLHFRALGPVALRQHRRGRLAGQSSGLVRF